MTKRNAGAEGARRQKIIEIKTNLTFEYSNSFQEAQNSRNQSFL